ncbi:MAG: prepilin-type N-terminal cleavage/methylation domain-containing protein [Aestuariivirga sp.]|uniref:prepilin-type N-terminal cleavage/methylation domain-containing protein n=1 Tax=Aestuariivirga sp. TaxID=2650926 RepID=UPI0025BF1C8C|nr:prepilin-type N-terminal cleavage/methylation domain-containing protein [Aestuariivirga sp.]MCA3561117.1 prepilin-type N-terminal cleavage/methylation domain-containing protein [Aestuariivirga sp.]
MSRRYKGETGFSLVEVLCALAVAASAIAVLTSGVGSSLKGVSTLDQHLGARIILQSILEDELAAAQTEPARRTGDSGPYRWQLMIEPVAAPAKLDGPYRMYRLTASVGWGRGGQVTGTALKLSR